MENFTNLINSYKESIDCMVKEIEHDTVKLNISGQAKL